MENRINIAELLKDCPKGMELDCPMFEGVEFDHIDEYNGTYPIVCRVKSTYGGYNTHTFTEYGCYQLEKYSKCVLFPKGKTTWEGFQKPFKDGDILAYTSSHTTVFIYRNKDDKPKYTTSFYVGCTTGVGYCDFHIYNKFKLIALNGNCDVRFATEKEKQKLFDVIKANGYKWNHETKTLEILVEPKFKVGDRIKCIVGIEWEGIITEIRPDNFYKVKCGNVVKYFNIKFQDRYELLVPKFKTGDRIKHKGNGIYCTLGEYAEGISAYHTNIGLSITYKDMEQWELAPNKFDISTLKPFESRVLVRNSNDNLWVPAIFGFSNGKKICVVSGALWDPKSTFWEQAIPYEGNEHLLGTTNDCDDFYKIW